MIDLVKVIFVHPLKILNHLILAETHIIIVRCFLILNEEIMPMRIFLVKYFLNIKIESYWHTFFIELH